MEEGNYIIRYFENGVAIAALDEVTVEFKLSKKYRRILGRYDPFNNGTSVAGSIALGKYEGCVLFDTGKVITKK
ncbi:MAG: hypothetical protein ACE5OP_14150 [Candidatus Glassbacteria bacterium]